MRVSVSVLALLTATALPAADLRTHGERSDYRETGRYAEVEAQALPFYENLYSQRLTF